jgi:AAA family ATP:ADP antiporter
MQKEMGKWRRFFWPVYGHEHRRLIPMFFLFFLISFVYNTLRCIKVTLIVTAPGAGTEVLPFLKVWGVLPGAILLTFIYTKLLNRFNREIVFYIMISLFLGFFLLFLTVLLPNSGILELSSVTEWLTNHLPLQMKKGLHGLIMMIRYWHFSTFYVLSELWSAMVLSVLFWGFANEVTTVHEAKRFYAIFALGANSSGILSGQWAQLFVLKKTYDFLPFGTEPWEQSLILQVSILVLVGVFIMGLFYWMNHTVFKTEKVAHNLQHNSVSKETLSPTLYSPFIFSIETNVSLDTLYCFPPVCITANSIKTILHDIL